MDPLKAPLPHIIRILSPPSLKWIWETMTNVYYLLIFDTPVTHYLDYSLVETADDVTILDDGVFEMPKVPVVSKSKSAVTSALQKQLEDDIADESVLMNQYLTANHESTRISQLEIDEEKKGNTNFDDVTQDGN